MKELNKKAFEGLAQLLVSMVALIFLPAWTLHYWRAWVFLLVFGVSVFLVTVYLMRHDPALLERRINAGPGAEKQKKQKLIQTLASTAFIAVFVVSALDYRFVWTSVELQVSLCGDVLVALGLYIVFRVFKENSYTSATIEAVSGQHVITTGPYSIVRHPMYSGAFIMLIGIPFALGSLWGLLAVMLLMLSIVWRLLDEEKFLTQNLSGYTEYKSKTHYRLIPHIW